jgi:hypothetical protein
VQVSVFLSEAEKRMEDPCADAYLLAASVSIMAANWTRAQGFITHVGSLSLRGLQLQAWWLECQSLYMQGELQKCCARIQAGLPDVIAHHASSAVGTL